VLVKAITVESDFEILTDALWALSYLSDGDEARIQTVIDAQIVPGLQRCLGFDMVQIQIPAVRSLGNIATGNDLQTDLVVNNDEIIDKLYGLLFSAKGSVKRETCWTFSNIMAGTPE